MKMTRKDKLQSILDKIDELETAQAGGLSASTKEVIIPREANKVAEVNIQPTKKKNEQVKKIIKKADKLNKRHRPKIVYQGGNKLYVDENDYWGADDKFRCPHCAKKIKMQDAAEQMNILMKKQRATKGGQVEWNTYITEVAKLPMMRGKPRSAHMKAASKLRGEGISLEAIGDYTGTGLDF
jgi:hypothetical protein